MMLRKLYLITIIVTLFTISCKSKKEPVIERYWIDVITCDFEKQIAVNSKLTFQTSKDSFKLTVPKTHLSNQSRSGLQSIVIKNIDSLNLFSLNNLKVNQLVEISIWQKQGDTNTFIKATINENKTISSNYKLLAKAKKGWVQHFISIPIIAKNSSLVLHLLTKDSTATFDDLNIKIYPVMPTNDILNSINIYIPNKQKNKINNYIDNALNGRVIPQSSKKYITAYFIKDNDSIKFKMKLKGDWTDHIKPDKASYRIKLPKSTSYQGMTTFSIQHPKTRNYINEWLVHKIAENNDVLTTKYNFVNVTINNYNYGVYATEEHFDKHIIENNNRREGPILKLDESGVWALQEKRFNSNFEHEMPFFESSTISVFKKKRTKKSISLTKQFNEAKKLVQLFKSGHKNIEDVFDIDQLALYYAIVEMSGYYHALTWHNRRFYYNPITQKLENILFDVIPYPNQQHDIMMDIITNTEKDKNLIIDNAIILNTKFKDKYFYYIKKISSKKYLDSIFKQLDEELSVIYPAIKNEKPKYKFSKQDFYAQAKFIREGIDNLNKLWEEKLKQTNDINFWMKDVTYKPFLDTSFIPEVSINAYCSMSTNGKYELSIENYHLNAINLIGYSVQKNSEIINFNTKVKLNRFIDTVAHCDITIDSLPKRVYFSANNLPNKILSKKVIQWEIPHGMTTELELKQTFNPKSKLYNISGNTLTFNTNITIEKLIYIPKKYNVIIPKGSIIELMNGGGIIINNSLSCLGSEKESIHIFCKDNSSQGITVLKGKSAKIAYTNISGLSNLNYKNWMQTGALTIYETETEISHLTISNNTSEDALNIIRSNFNISNLNVKKTTSDGFDADFCTGSITNSTFFNTGNDCIDFSGSTVKISNINITNSGDKGISAGESSNLILNNITINGAITAIASKDNSKIIGQQIRINNSEFGLSAFQKKPTYGPATINLSNCELTSVNQISLVEVKSIITINSIIYQGKTKLDIDELYKQFNKK